MSLNKVEETLDWMMNKALGDKEEGSITRKVYYYTAKPMSADFVKEYPGSLAFNNLIETDEINCSLKWAKDTASYRRIFRLNIGDKTSEFEIFYEVLFMDLVGIKREIYKDLIPMYSEYLTDDLLWIGKKKPKPTTDKYYYGEISANLINDGSSSNDTNVVEELLKVCPGLDNRLDSHCPANPICKVNTNRLTEWVIHLNDEHKWARSPAEAQVGQLNIADWLDEVALLKGWDLSLKLPDKEAESSDPRQIDFAEEVKKKKAQIAQGFAQAYGIPLHTVDSQVQDTSSNYKDCLFDPQKLVGQTLHVNVPKLDPNAVDMQQLDEDLKKTFAHQMDIIKKSYLEGFEQ